MKSLSLVLCFIASLITVEHAYGDALPKKVSMSHEQVKEFGFDVSQEIAGESPTTWLVHFRWPKIIDADCVPARAQVFIIGTNGEEVAGISFDYVETNERSELMFYFQPKSNDASVRVSCSRSGEAGSTRAVVYSIDSVKGYF
ncbi:hypothetical protein [Parahalioglobus pacificus]|uniref:Uncharacterized protein n=1 Tax=Parahalioglobus pacificus TaxID=930806 RepID=A0A918XG05_9GAMM|nr:hypothetical protein [Halioglobus pacificus]GHD29541.1 hypothetical protein GCM10007053_10260 [Halioglobus pacificus]